MPICMWASTQPGNARRFLASNTCFACSAWISGARRAIFPSLIAMSRQSTDVLLGRTTRAFLITRSNGFSIPLFPCRRCRPAAMKIWYLPVEQFGPCEPSASSDFSTSPARASFPAWGPCERVVSFAEREHLRRSDQFIEAGEVEHAGTERLGGSAGGERGVIFTRHARQCAHDAAG